jgi:hypothetical protein
MPFFGQEVLEQAQAKGPITDAAYIKARDAARRLREDMRNRLLATLAKEKLDAVVAPTEQPAWVTDHVLGDRPATGSVIPSLIAALAGTPSITVPVGDSHGLPLGFMFMGSAYAPGMTVLVAQNGIGAAGSPSSIAGDWGGTTPSRTHRVNACRPALTTAWCGAALTGSLHPVPCRAAAALPLRASCRPRSPRAVDRPLAALRVRRRCSGKEPLFFLEAGGRLSGNAPKAARVCRR